MRVFLILTAALMMSACASTGLEDRSGTGFAARAEACAQRGGVLALDLGGYSTGRGYSCEAPGLVDPRSPMARQEVR